MTTQVLHDKRRAQNIARLKAGKTPHLWRYRLKGWLRQFPAWILKKLSLSHWVEAQVQARTQELFRQAHYDALTHLPNRAYFMETVEHTLKTAEKETNNFALLFLDLDGFKPVNDMYGHGAGDELLRLVAARLVSSVRDYDFAARLGGDEFVILLRDVVDDEIIETISKRIIQEVSQAYWVDGKAVHVSTSIGITEYPQDGKTVNQLLERADQALYVAKRRGRKQFCFYRQAETIPEAMPDKLQTRFEVDVEHQKFDIYFRPIVRLSDHVCRGAQLDVRWRDAPLASPWYKDWQQLLHRSQWSISMALWMIDSAAYYCAQWGKPDKVFSVSVPLDQSLLLEEHVATLLMQRLTRYSVSPAQLQLRIELESLYRLDQKAVQALNSLHEAGFEIILSGVGAAQLDLALLSRISLDGIALEGEWIQAQWQCSEGLRWVQGVIAMARGLGVRIHVEQIAHADQSAWLSDMGVETAEGLSFYPPMPADLFSANCLQSDGIA